MDLQKIGVKNLVEKQGRFYLTIKANICYLNRTIPFSPSTVHYIYRGIISLMLISIALQQNQELQELYELRAFFAKQTNYDLS